MPSLSQSLLFRNNTTVGNTSTTSVVYPNTASSTVVVVSDKVKGDGYYNGSTGLHTVMYVTTSEFEGSISMQASLATDPSDNDWFFVKDTTTSYTSLNIRNDSSVDIHNFVGNFVWVRGHVSIDNGSVQFIHYNH